MLLNIPQDSGEPLTAKNYLVQNVSSIKDEKACTRGVTARQMPTGSRQIMKG